MGDYTDLPTPPQCYVDFCLIPVSHANLSPQVDFRSLTTNQVGTGNTSVAKEIAEVQKLLKASGLTYTLHSAGTTVGMFTPFPPVQSSCTAILFSTDTIYRRQLGRCHEGHWAGALCCSPGGRCPSPDVDARWFEVSCSVLWMMGDGGCVR